MSWRWMASGLMVLILTGCPGDWIELETDTVVSPDESVTRTVHYRAAGSGKNELDTRYELPEGGTWETRKAFDYDADTGETKEKITHIYSWTRTYAPGEEMVSDHARKGKAEGRFFRNQIQLDTTDYFFVTVFTYRETHADPDYENRLRAAVSELYPVWMSALVAELAKLEGVDVTDARRAVEEICDPWVEKLKEPGFIREALEREGDDLDDAMITELAARLPRPSGEDADAWKEAFKNALNDVSESIPHDDDMEEAIFGVYDFCLFCPSYRFTQTLTMPGTLVSTNAASVDGNVLTWEFDEKAFWAGEHVLEARSRIFHPLRLAGATLLLALAFLYWGPARRRASTSGSELR